MRIQKKKIGRSSFSNSDDPNLKKYLELKKIDNNLNNLNRTILNCSRQTLTRIIYYNKIYEQILNKPGVVMEFGVEYGATISLLTKLRGVYEPYNYSRKIIGFDTFSGFTGDLTKYEKKAGWKKNDYSTIQNYENYLNKIIKYEEDDAPINHLKKFELIKGDASSTVKKYLKKHKQTIIALAIFDMDVYKPTKNVLEAIKNRLYKGSILVFDEINHPDFPGETIALLESLGIRNLKLKNFHGETFSSYVVLD